MQMSNEEIIRHYNQAKDKKADIEILADLNLVKPEAIKKILGDAGLLRRKYERKAPAANAECAENHSADQSADVLKSADIYQRLESIIEGVPEDAGEHVRTCAYNLCRAMYLEYLRKRLRAGND